MTDIVLAVPIGAASFQRATETVSEEVAARVREWPAVTVIVDGVAYIPLRTDWMPPKERRTADGVAVLLDSRTWPDKVRQAVAARKVVRVSRRVVGEFWKCIATCGLSEERKQSEAPAVAPGCVADDHVLPQNSAVEENMRGIRR